MDGRAPILDPISRLSEIMFGLLMALTFTGTMSVAVAGGASVRSVLAAALGCNIGWGIVDGVMSVLTGITERNRDRATGIELRRAAPERARAILREHLPGAAAADLTDAELDRLVARARQTEAPAFAGARASDLRAAVAIFALVVLATFPPVLPFLIFDELHRAMRWSNAIAVASLFVIGRALDREMGGGWRMSLSVPLVGSVLVATTIALGG